MPLTLIAMIGAMYRPVSLFEMGKDLFQMLDPDSNHIIVFRKTFQNRHAGNSFFAQDTFPRIFLIAGHIVSGMISGNRHERYQISFFDAFFRGRGNLAHP